MSETASFFKSEHSQGSCPTHLVANRDRGSHLPLTILYKRKDHKTFTNHVDTFKLLLKSSPFADDDANALYPYLMFFKSANPCPFLFIFVYLTSKFKYKLKIVDVTGDRTWGCRRWAQTDPLSYGGPP